jgi:muramoyltetrapeptide carboxypeptidase
MERLKLFQISRVSGTAARISIAHDTTNHRPVRARNWNTCPHYALVSVRVVRRAASSGDRCENHQKLRRIRRALYHSGVLIPPPVRPGSVVRVIAPSGPFDRTLFFRGLGWLGARYRTIWSRGLLERTGYLAGDDRRRLEELNRALCDPSASAVIAVRGGYGATRISHEADFSALRRYPKWLIGFSDITALHVEAQNVGVASLHGPNLSALGRADQDARLNLCRVLEAPSATQAYAALEIVARGSASGTLVGGNLSLLLACAASGRLALPRGCILFFEEVGEAPYRIDRMLTSLLVSKRLDAVAGICVGDLASDGTPEVLLDVVRERLGTLGIPILARLPIGHGRQNQPLPLGVPALLRDAPAELIVNPRIGDS